MQQFIHPAARQSEFVQHPTKDQRLLFVLDFLALKYSILSCLLPNGKECLVRVKTMIKTIGNEFKENDWRVRQFQLQRQRIRNRSSKNKYVSTFQAVNASLGEVNPFFIASFII
jgi:hypothetical protein